MRESKSQFELPRGLLGRLAGRGMAWWTRGANEFVVEQLDVQPADQVLEIGFGHGRTIGLLAKGAPQGFVAGVDHSETMLKQASGRNRGLIEAGRVVLKLGSVSQIPYEDGRFDKACSVHNVYFWPSPVDDLREIRRVMKEGGRLVIGFRIKDDSEHGLQAYGPAGNISVDEIERWLEQAGFHDVERTLRDFMQEKAACLRARA